MKDHARAIVRVDGRVETPRSAGSRPQRDNESGGSGLADEAITFIRANRQGPFMLFLWNYTAPTGAHPVIANGKMYLRDQGVRLAYDVRAK